MDPTSAAIVAFSELAKMGLQMWFEFMRASGQTAEQIAEAFARAKLEFDARKPSDLLDI